MSTFEVGQKVVKPQGYKFDSTIVAVFETTAGQTRVVAENGEGLLHIFNEKQLEHANEADIHGGFRWSQKVRIEATGDPRLNGREGQIEGFQLGNPLVANVRIMDHLINVSYAYNVKDLVAL